MFTNRSRTRQVAELVTLTAVATVLCLGCGGPDPALGTTAELRVHRGPLVRMALLTGAIEAVESAQIVVPRTREHRLQIQWLAADISMVSAGDRVLDFDNSSFTANLDQQRTALQRSRRNLLLVRAQGDATLREAEASVERARIVLAKAELDASVPESLRSRFDHRQAQLALVKAGGEHEKAMADLRSSRTKVASDIQVSEEQHRKNRRELNLAEEAVAAFRLTAPRDGIIVVEENPREDRKFQVGDTVFAGWTVLAIPDLDRLRVRASLSDVDDGLLDVGMAARCTPDIEPDLELQGHISEITPIAREQAMFSERRGFDVTIDLESLPGENFLVPGMSVRVEVEIRADDALLIPRASVDFSTSPPRALRHNGSWAEVRLGQCSAQSCVLIDGLAEGVRLGTVAEVAS